jgi:hypothetical protein
VKNKFWILNQVFFPLILFFHLIQNFEATLFPVKEKVNDSKLPNSKWNFNNFKDKQFHWTLKTEGNFETSFPEIAP